MLIKSLSGKTIVETSHRTMRGALEYCAEHGIDLAFADLRKARLCHASLDGIQAAGASFWGADFTGTDMGFADLRNTDLRCASLKDACLAESDLGGANLQGAYFSGTLVEGARLDGAFVSCPSFWDCDLEAASIAGLTYNHLGEMEISLSAPPLVIRGLQKRLVLAPGFCLWGNELCVADVMPLEAAKALFAAKTIIEKCMRLTSLQPAKNPIPKILKRQSGF